MAVNVIRDAQIHMDERNLTGDMNACAINFAAEMLDNTRLGDTTRVKIGGLKSLVVNAEGFFDPATSEGFMFDRIGGGQDALTIGVDGAADEDPCYLMQVESSEYNPFGVGIGELNKFSFAAEASDAPLIRGQIAKNATGIAASATGPAIQLGALSATQILYLTEHIEAFTGTSIQIDIESDDHEGMTSAIVRASLPARSAVGGFFTAAITETAVADDWWRISYTVVGGAPDIDLVSAFGIQ